MSPRHTDGKLHRLSLSQLSIHQILQMLLKAETILKAF